MNVSPSVRGTVQSSYVQRGPKTMAMMPCPLKTPVLLKRKQRRRDSSKGGVHQGSSNGKVMAGLETQMETWSENTRGPHEGPNSITHTRRLSLGGEWGRGAAASLARHTGGERPN